MKNRIQTPFFILLTILLGVTACVPKTQETYTPVIDPANFVAVVDNPYMPLTPGTTFVYEGNTEKGNEHNEVYVSSETKVIMGVTCVVVKDTVLVDGVLEEKTLDWYAQDKQGNVWYFGEASSEYQNGAVVSTKGSWEAGVDGAQPGIVMEAHPAGGDFYRQEFLLGDAEDLAEVVGLTESVTVPLQPQPFDFGADGGRNIVQPRRLDVLLDKRDPGKCNLDRDHTDLPVLDWLTQPTRLYHEHARFATPRPTVHP
jgi:hypothetical protein